MQNFTVYSSEVKKKLLVTDEKVEMPKRRRGSCQSWKSGTKKMQNKCRRSRVVW